MWLALQIALTFLLFAVAGAAPWIGKNLGLDPPVIGAFTGALVGAAATMLGGLLARLTARADKASSDAERRATIKTLIAAELANVAASYFQLERTIRVAQETLGRGEIALRGQDFQDFSNEMPRSMPLTSGLGPELLVLSTSEIDVLSTLMLNMDLTRPRLEEFSSGKRSLNLLTAGSLSQEVAHDMNLLAQAFERIAPSRRLAFRDQPVELASVLLRRLANELTKSECPARR
jgi:hypothetical protein